MQPRNPRATDRSRENNLCPRCYAATVVCECGCGQLTHLYSARGATRRFYSRACYANMEEVRQKASRRMSKTLTELWQQPEYREEKTGVHHHRWNGGPTPYSPGFTKGLKRSIKKRDGFRCQNPDCPHKNSRPRLHVHHIDENRQNNKPENLITLCIHCHLRHHFSGTSLCIEHFNYCPTAP